MAKQKTKNTIQPKILSQNWFAWLIILIAIVGLVASVVLTLDKIEVLRDPNYNPACNINPIFSCGSVMKTAQAEIGGVPNTLVGLAAFPALMMVGVVMLFGAKMNKRFWQIFQIATILGLAGVIYLFYQGVYRINALCIYCMSVWVVVLLLAWYTTLWNLHSKNIILPKRFDNSVKFIMNNNISIIVLVYAVFAGLVLSHFWYYFSTLLP